MTAWLAAVLLAVLGTAGPSEPVEPLELRAMTFNLRYGTAQDGANAWPARRHLVMTTIERNDPDILGVQEALRFQLDEIAVAFPSLSELGVGRDDGVSAGEYSAILFRSDRLTVAAGGTFWLSDTPTVPGSATWGNQIPRICTWARFVDRKTARPFYVFNLHLDHESQASRERAIELLLREVRDRAFDDPVIVMGDFNAGESNAAIERLRGGTDPTFPFRNSLRVLRPTADSVGTFHGFLGTTGGDMIDAIFLSPQWTPLEVAIDRWPGAIPYPSDHFPVTATLRLPD